MKQTARNLQPAQDQNAKRTISGVRRKLDSVDETAPDSCPTPIFVLGYKDIHLRFTMLAERFENHALKLSHRLDKLDLFTASECREAARYIRKLADRTLDLPKKIGDDEVNLEKSYLCEQFSAYTMYAHKIINS